MRYIYIYIYPPPCPWGTKWSVQCPLWMSWDAGWSVRMSPWTPGLIDFKGPHPKLLASTRLHRTPHFSIKNSITFPYRFFIDFWWIFGPTWPPKPSQNPTKINKKSILNPIIFLITFLIDLFIDCWWFWVPKSIQNQPSKAMQSHTQLILPT